MPGVLRSLVQIGVYYGISELLWQRREARLRLQRILRGAALMISAGVIGFLGVLALIGSLFFFIAGIPNLAEAAFLTAVIVLLVSVFVSVQAIGSMRNNPQRKR